MCGRSLSIYAVGSARSIAVTMYGLVAPLWEQAKVLADHITGKNPRAAYHGSKVATKLKVMGVEVAAMGIADPQTPEDEVIQFSDPKRGTYKKLIIREGRLVGGILLGDISKAAYLMQSFDRNTPLPEERLRLLFDIGDPPKKVTFEEMSAGTQICNCNGVSKGASGGVRGLRQAQSQSRDGRDTRGHGLRLLQGDGDGNCGVGLRRADRGRPFGALLRAGCAAHQAGVDSRDPRAQPEIGFCGVSMHWREARRTRPASRVWPRC